MQYHWHQTLWYNQAAHVGPEFAQAFFQHSISIVFAASQVPIPLQHWVAPLSIMKFLKKAWKWHGIA